MNLIIHWKFFNMYILINFLILKKTFIDLYLFRPINSYVSAQCLNDKKFPITNRILNTIHVGQCLNMEYVHNRSVCSTNKQTYIYVLVILEACDHACAA